MGVWSSISFCHSETQSHTADKCRHPRTKQFINVDSNNFTTTLSQDVQEFKIQESFSENSLEHSAPPSCYKETENFSTNFEYSMGGNLDFYKEHLKHDYLKTKLPPAEYLRRQRKISVSDNDSDPEAMRYSRKSHVPNAVDIIAEEREADLSFDDYSTIYQPDFLLSIKSEPLSKKTPKKAHVIKEADGLVDIRREGKTADVPVVKSTEKLNKSRSFATTAPSPLARGRSPTSVTQDIEENDVFDYDDCSFLWKGQHVQNDKKVETTGTVHFLENELLGTNERKSRLREKDWGKRAEEKQPTKRTVSSTGRRQEKNSDFAKKRNVLETADVSLVNSHDNTTNEEFICFKDRKTGNDIIESVGNDKNAGREFYPDSPAEEEKFFKTPCSTRQNSLESLADSVEERCTEKVDEKKHHKTSGLGDLPLGQSMKFKENLDKLPQEFQEMARRLSKKEECKKSRPSLPQVSLLQNFSCSSSSSCSTISPRSPSRRTPSRTPSYKMPKTPSLSRHHPATYVTQHTSSRSRPSSRVSSRATSPTREDQDSFSVNELMQYARKKDYEIHREVQSAKDTPPKERKRNLRKTIR